MAPAYANMLLLVAAAVLLAATAGLARAEPVLLVGGAYQNAGSSDARNLAQYNGTEWFALASQFTAGTVRTLTEYNGKLVAGGTFATAGSEIVNCVAAYDGQQWTGFLGGVHDDYNQVPDVYSVYVYNGDLYVGGDFTHAGATAADNIAAWNGSAFRPLGAGLTGFPFAMVEYQESLYVAGDFITAGGVFSPDLARWDGAAWHSVAQGIANVTCAVYALAVYRDALIVGGVFGSASGVAADGIVQWDGAAYAPLGDGLGMDLGLPVYVYSLAVYKDMVIAGGRFSRAGGADAERVARWDGTSWAPLGLGVDNIVYALAVFNDVLVAGGMFEYADGNVRANGLATWDGTAWGTIDFANQYSLTREVLTLLPSSRRW